MRHLAAGSISLLLVMSAVTYALAPAGEALAAVVSVIASKPGHESIEGKVQGAAVTLRVVKTEGGRTVTVSTVKVARGGHFKIAVSTGAYRLIITRGSKKVIERLNVKSDHSDFVVVKVNQANGLVGIAPVVFNY